jgi:hypothetical protein
MLYKYENMRRTCLSQRRNATQRDVEFGLLHPGNLPKMAFDGRRAALQGKERRWIAARCR